MPTPRVLQRSSSAGPSSTPVRRRRPARQSAGTARRRTGPRQSAGRYLEGARSAVGAGRAGRGGAVGAALSVRGPSRRRRSRRGTSRGHRHSAPTTRSGEHGERRPTARAGPGRSVTVQVTGTVPPTADPDVRCDRPRWCADAARGSVLQAGPGEVKTVRLTEVRRCSMRARSRRAWSPHGWSWPTVRPCDQTSSPFPAGRRATCPARRPSRTAQLCSCLLCDAVSRRPADAERSREHHA